MAAAGWFMVASQSQGADLVPDGLSTSDWSSIRAAYEAKRHEAFTVEDGYLATNPGQQWRTRFDGRGFLTTPNAGGWSWGLELVSYGRAGAECAVTLPTCSDADVNRISYQWGDALTEWYINDARGLEHGYTMHRRPHGVTGGTPRFEQITARKGRAPSRAQRPSHSNGDRSITVAALTITLAVRGGLRPIVSGDGRHVSFVDNSGAAVVNYSNLTVFDATGRTLSSWFVEASGQPAAVVDDPELPLFAIRHLQFISIVIDDADAVYPLTIDPIAQQAYLKASNTEATDNFGISVAVSGETVVVGAVAEDSNATGVNGNQSDNSASASGAAYVYVRSGGVWSQQAYLKASNTDAADNFGVSVAVSGDTVVVGATREDSSATGVNGNQADNSALEAGAAYVFVRSAGVWGQQAYLKASNTGAGDQFGNSVAVSGDTILVGASQEDSSATGVDGNPADNSAADSGAAYVFVRSGGVWSQQAYLKASNTGAADNFGNSAAVSGDTVVVGASGEDSNATGVNGNQADNSAGNSGAAYVFARNVGVWSQQAYLKASNTDAADNFSNSVAVSGDTVVVGANGEDSNATGVNGNQSDNSAAVSGAAYVFVRNGGVWSQQAYLKASNTGSFDTFGYSVAVSGDTVVVGARGEASSATGVNGNQANNSAASAGAAYVFIRDDDEWSQQAYLKASNTGGGRFLRQLGCHRRRYGDCRCESGGWKCHRCEWLQR